jgi:hypothetical protein
MTVADKIAALPPKCPSFEIVNGEVRYRYPERLFRAEAERDLALEVLRDLMHYAAENSAGVLSCYEEYQADEIKNARAVLAACGGESRECI